MGVFRPRKDLQITYSCKQSTYDRSSTTGLVSDEGHPHILGFTIQKNSHLVGWAEIISESSNMCSKLWICEIEGPGMRGRSILIKAPGRKLVGQSGESPAARNWGSGANSKKNRRVFYSRGRFGTIGTGIDGTGIDGTGIDGTGIDGTGIDPLN